MVNSPVVEVAPLERCKLSRFENNSSLETVAEGKKNEHCPEEMTVDWPSVRKTSSKFASSSESAVSTTSSPPAKPKSSGKEQGRSKGNRKKRDS